MSAAAPSGEAAPGTATAGDGQAKPGFARGRITGQEGKPIAAKGARVQVSMSGISDQSGERVQYNPAVKADGTYEQKLVDGSYHFSVAVVEVPYERKNYRFELEPVQDIQGDRPASEGIVQDFVWKIQGQRPRSDGDPGNHTHWYGATASLQYSIYREDVKKAVDLPTPGTKFLFTLTPKGPLIDGSPGKTLTIEREWTDEMSVTSSIPLHDLPIGSYTLEGEIIRPDGERKTAVFQFDYAKYAPKLELAFAPNLIMNATHTALVSFGEQME